MGYRCISRTPKLILLISASVTVESLQVLCLPLLFPNHRSLEHIHKIPRPLWMGKQRGGAGIAFLCAILLSDLSGRAINLLNVYREKSREFHALGGLIVCLHILQSGCKSWNSALIQYIWTGYRYHTFSVVSLWPPIICTLYWPT